MYISPERAAQVLAEHPEWDQDTTLYRFFEANIAGTLLAYYHERLVWFRDEYSDQLPDVDVRTLPIMHMVDQNRLHWYKCQTNYLIGVTTHLRATIDYGLVDDPDMIAAIHEFITSDLNFKVGDPENVDRLARVNSILATVIAYLEEKLPS